MDSAYSRAACRPTGGTFVPFTVRRRRVARVATGALAAGMLVAPAAAHATAAGAIPERPAVQWGSLNGTVTGLQAGGEYPIDVRATTAAGPLAGGFGLPAYVGYAAPPTPIGLRVTSGYESLTFSFVQPTAGGDPATSWTYSLDGGQSWQYLYTTAGSDGRVTDTVYVTNGRSYTVLVKASNLGGDSAATAPVTVTLPTYDAVQTYYHAINGTALLGTPTGGEYAVAGGLAQEYTHGAIYWSPATGAHEVHGLILARYKALGGPAGILGFPLTDETDVGDGVGRFNDFANHATIDWSPATGAWSVHGGILDKWAALGWETGILGYPTTDESGTPDGIGRFNHFSGSGGASVYWTPMYGAWSIHGDIRARWASLGWETGFLGYPTSDETFFSTGGGEMNHFSGGSVYWTHVTGAWSIHGAIQASWGAEGWDASQLGVPTSDEYAIPGGRAENFYNGRMTFSFTTGRTATAVRSPNYTMVKVSRWPGPPAPPPPTTHHVV
jgi:uncharacterized protein with LGFP repeats